MMLATKEAKLQPSSSPWPAILRKSSLAQENAPLLEGHVGAGGHLGLSHWLQRAAVVALTLPHLPPPLQLCAGGRGGGRAAAAVPAGENAPPG